MALSNMLPSAHVFSHQQQHFQSEPSWMHQQTHHHAQQQAQAQAQQQHYNRIAASHNNQNQALGPLNAQIDAPAASVDGMSEDSRRVLNLVADLMNDNMRESALLELSKKRESVSELALILWHSFGM